MNLLVKTIKTVNPTTIDQETNWKLQVAKDLDYIEGTDPNDSRSESGGKANREPALRTLKLDRLYRSGASVQETQKVPLS